MTTEIRSLKKAIRIKPFSVRQASHLLFAGDYISY